MKLPEEFEKIQPSEIEIAKKVVKKYGFVGFPTNVLEHIFNRLKDELSIDDIDGFEIYSYKLLDVYPQYDSCGFKTYSGCLQVTYISKERELYILRY